MKKNSYRIPRATLTLVALGLPLSSWAQVPANHDQPAPLPASAADTRTTRADKPMEPARSSLDRMVNARQRATEWVGLAVRNSEDEDLGRVSDLVLNTETGEVTFAIVRSGGVLGLGATERAIPFRALQPAPDDDELVIQVDRARWEAAEEFREDQLSTLARENQGERIYQHFGETWQSAESAAPRPVGAEVGQSPAGTGLYLASTLEGKEILQGDQTLGTVEDVVVQPDGRTAALLIEPAKAGSSADAPYIVSFDQVSLEGRDDEMRIRTELSAAELESRTEASPRAAGLAAAATPRTPSTDRAVARADAEERRAASSRTASPDEEVRFADATANPQNRPQSPVTREAGSTSGTASAEDDQVRFASATANPPNRPQAPKTETSADLSASTTSTPEADLDQIRASLRDDAQIRAAAARVDVSQRGQAIVLRGTVSDRLVHEQILNLVRSQAEGAEVRDEIRVVGAAE